MKVRISLSLYYLDSEIWGKETLKPKSTDTWKWKSSEDTWVFMDYNLNSGGMKQSRHNIFKQNAHLIKISLKKCRPLGCLPIKALITTEVREAESV